MISSITAFTIVLYALYGVNGLVVNQRNTPARNTLNSKSVLYYNYFPFKKNDEKPEIGRLMKNILFPGIYREYADTKEVRKTIVIDTRKDIKVRSRNEGDSFQSQESKSGSYASVDETTAPKVVATSDIKSVKLKPITKPANFVPSSSAPKIAVPKLGGVSVLPDIKKYTRAKKPIILYEYEASTDCKKVREACSMLDINVEFRPCPGATAGWSDVQSTLTLGGKRTVPFMVDNNPSMIKPQLTGSTQIINYLFNTYGPGEKAIPSSLKGSSFSLPSNKGTKLRANARPDFRKILPLTLYGYEGVSGVKAVREVLTELGLAHTLINCANGSTNRDLIVKKKGFFDVPFLVDPNTKLELFNANDIVKYLEATYTI